MQSALIDKGLQHVSASQSILEIHMWHAGQNAQLMQTVQAQKHVRICIVWIHVPEYAG